MNFLVFEHWFMSIRISQTKNNLISENQARYATSIVAKYLDTATVKTITKFYNTNFPYDMTLTKADASTIGVVPAPYENLIFVYTN